LSERALENQQQALERHAAASSRKRAREVKKKGIDPPAEPTAALGLTVDGNSADSVEVGLNDSTVAAALREQLQIDEFVPGCWLHPLTQHLGGNSTLLLADLDFEDPLCLKKLDEIRKASSSSSSSSPPQVLSEDSLEAWVASAQTCVVHTIMKALLGGSRRLLKALRTQGQRAPSNLRAWRLMPELLYQRLLEADSGLATTCLTRRKGPSNEEVTELFSAEWVQWMCGVCEDMRQSPSLLWMDRFNYDVDDDEDEDEDEEINNAGDSGWINVNDGSNSVGCTVRCYPLSDDYWDDGIVMAYLPPDEEEPTALWRVQGDMISKCPNAAEGAASDPGSHSGRKRWTLDLEEQELTDAKARQASVNSK
jgi:hypothetical protein